MQLNNISLSKLKRFQFNTFLVCFILFVFFIGVVWFFEYYFQVENLTSQLWEYFHQSRALELKNQEIHSLKAELDELKKSQRETLTQLEEAEETLVRVIQDSQTSMGNSSNSKPIFEALAFIGVVLITYNYILPNLIVFIQKL